MSTIHVSSVFIKKAPFIIEERDPASNLTEVGPVLTFLASTEVVELTLENVREFKQLFYTAEQHLQLRAKQAMLAKNLTLDLGV
jgi:hypothetical protein